MSKTAIITGGNKGIGLEVAKDLISKDYKAYSYLSKSVKNFPSSNNFIDQLQQIGFSKCNHYSLTFGVVSLYIAIK